MDSNKEKKNFMYVSLCLPCKLIRPRLLYPRKKFLCFGIRQESASGTAGGDTLKANECFLSDAPPGKECADRMGDSPPGRRGRAEVQCRRQKIRQRENSISRRKQPEKKRGIANVRKNSGSYMQSIYAENSVAGAKISEKIFRKIVDNALFVCYD